MEVKLHKLGSKIEALNHQKSYSRIHSSIDRLITNVNSINESIELSYANIKSLKLFQGCLCDIQLFIRTNSTCQAHRAELVNQLTYLKQVDETISEYIMSLVLAQKNIKYSIVTLSL